MLSCPICKKPDDVCHPAFIPCGERGNNFLMNILYSSKQIEDNETIAEYTFDEQAWSLIRHWQNDKEIEFSNNGEDHIIAIFRKIQDYAFAFLFK